MNQGASTDADDEMRAEYDFSGGERGKHYEQYQQGTNVVFLDADVAAVFRDSASVNEALRLIIGVARRQVGSAR
jgi:hypothetical protein